MAQEKLDTSGLDLQSIQIKDIKKLLNNIGNISDFDFAILDDDDSNLSKPEQNIKERLEKSTDQIKYIEDIINQIELKTIWDNQKKLEKIYKKEGKKTDINLINKKIEAQNTQKELIKKLYPELSEKPFVTDTHIRTFNEERGEYIISAEDLKIKLSEGGVEGNSYLEIMRYLKWIEKVEGNNGDLTRHLATILEDIIEGDIVDSEYQNEITLLKKHLPKNFLKNGNLEKFAEEFNIKINEFSIERAYAAEIEDETNEGELKLIIDNLIENLGETRAKELMQKCTKSGLTRDESIILLSQYSTSLKSEIKTYKEENKEYYEAKKQEKEIEKLNISENSQSSGNDIITNQKNYISAGPGLYKILGDNGQPINGLVISEDEKNNTIGNPEATENLINFYMFFKDLGLLGVWTHREKLIIAVGDININPNDGDSIKKEELRKFGNKLLTFIANIGNEGEGKKIELNNLSSVESELRKFSGASSMLSDGKTFNLKGEDKFTAYLRSQGIIGGAYFKISKFREKL